MLRHTTSGGGDFTRAVGTVPYMGHTILGRTLQETLYPRIGTYYLRSKGRDEHVVFSMDGSPLQRQHRFLSAL